MLRWHLLSHCTLDAQYLCDVLSCAIEVQELVLCIYSIDVSTFGSGKAFIVPIKWWLSALHKCFHKRTRRVHFYQPNIILVIKIFNKVLHCHTGQPGIYHKIHTQWIRFFVDVFYFSLLRRWTYSVERNSNREKRTSSCACLRNAAPLRMSSIKRR